jgi:hypothetical protein
MIPSRIERRHGHFAVAFGVDHVSGPFCQVWLAPIDQVWLAPIDQQEGALIVIDNRGVSVAGSGERGGIAFFRALWRERIRGERVNLLLEGVRARFAQAAAAGNPHPNLDHETATKLFRLFGFPESIGAEVFAAFD